LQCVQGSRTATRKAQATTNFYYHPTITEFLLFCYLPSIFALLHHSTTLQTDPQFPPSPRPPRLHQFGPRLPPRSLAYPGNWTKPQLLEQKNYYQACVHDEREARLASEGEAASLRKALYRLEEKYSLLKGCNLSLEAQAADLRGANTNLSYKVETFKDLDREKRYPLITTSAPIVNLGSSPKESSSTAGPGPSNARPSSPTLSPSPIIRLPSPFDPRVRSVSCPTLLPDDLGL
jgi:hypothetical protein